MKMFVKPKFYMMKKVAKLFLMGMVTIAMVSCDKAPVAADSDMMQDEVSFLKNLENPDPPECIEETAWGDGLLYNEGSSWATFTPTVMGEWVELWAGQNYYAGRVYFSTVPDMPGYVKIKILMRSCWDIQDVEEPIKVQGYDEPPVGEKVKTGQFEFKDFELNDDPNNYYYWAIVPYHDFFGVHVDIQYCCD
jgi:hypothetical protein